MPITGSELIAALEDMREYPSALDTPLTDKEKAAAGKRLVDRLGTIFQEGLLAPPKMSDAEAWANVIQDVRCRSRELDDQGGKKILFVWSAGGMVGLDILLGLWMALRASGIYSTHNRGTSAGAIMAAMNSTGLGDPHFQNILRSLRDKDVKRSRLFWRLRLPFTASFLRPGPVERTLKKYILPEFPEPSFDALAKPCSVCCTDERIGRTVELSSGNLRKAIQASAAIAGVFPSVTWSDGRQLSDGGTTAYLPYKYGDPANYDQVWLLVATPPLDFKDSAKNVIARLRRNVDWMIEDQVSDICDYVTRFDNVHVLRPQVETSEGSMHFDHDLIDECYRQGLAMIESETKKGEERDEQTRD